MSWPARFTINWLPAPFVLVALLAAACTGPDTIDEAATLRQAPPEGQSQASDVDPREQPTAMAEAPSATQVLPAPPPSLAATPVATAPAVLTPPALLYALDEEAKALLETGRPP